MPHWEYKRLKRTRKVGFGGPGEWIWERRLSGDVLGEMDREGWELVTVVPRSSIINRPGYVGVTNEEEWIFRRPREVDEPPSIE